MFKRCLPFPPLSLFTLAPILYSLFTFCSSFVLFSHPLLFSLPQTPAAHCLFAQKEADRFRGELLLLIQ